MIINKHINKTTLSFKGWRLSPVAGKSPDSLTQDP